MNSKMFTALSTVLLAAIALSGCTGGGGDEAIYGSATGGTLQGNTIIQAGSSTVLPLAEVWAEDFGFARGIQFKVSGGGSGAGVSGLCNKELDLGDMSRAIKDSETAKCRANGVEPVPWKIAFDGLSVVVSHENTFADDLSVEELEHIFRSDEPATRWSDVKNGYPNQPIRLCYPDSDSGTYEYFNEVILHEGEPRSGSGVQQSPDDNVLVTCLKDDQYAIGYFGYAYYLENKDRVKLVAIEGVKPTAETVANGAYSPLSRPIYIVTNGIPTGLLADYFRYVFHPEGGQALVPEVGYVALDDGTRGEMLRALQA